MALGSELASGRLVVVRLEAGPMRRPLTALLRKGTEVGVVARTLLEVAQT